MNGIVTAVSDDGLRFTNERMLLTLDKGELAGNKIFCSFGIDKNG